MTRERASPLSLAEHVSKSSRGPSGCECSRARAGLTAQLVDPVSGLRCLRGGETLPEDDIYDNRGRSEHDVEDRRATLRLGDPPGGCDFDVQAEHVQAELEPEPSLAMP